MRAKKDPYRVIMRYCGNILASDGMLSERQFIQHGGVSGNEHSLDVARLCVRMAEKLPFRVDERSLVRGALLHDYFLYDWHVPDKSHRFHGFIHAARAERNAERDFGLNRIERNMIRAHMFPMNLTLPRYRESVILCLADKICATRETFSGRKNKRNRSR